MPLPLCWANNTSEWLQRSRYSVDCHTFPQQCFQNSSSCAGMLQSILVQHPICYGMRPQDPKPNGYDITENLPYRKVHFLAFINTYKGQVLCSAAQKEYYPKVHCGHPLRATFKNFLIAFLKSCLLLLSIFVVLLYSAKNYIYCEHLNKNPFTQCFVYIQGKKRNSNTRLLDSLVISFPIQKVTWFCF